MPVPAGLSSDLAAYLAELDERVGRIETPKGFTPAFLTTSASLTTQSAARFGGKWAIITDLKTAAYSNGSHWVRIDTGATIV